MEDVLEVFNKLNHTRSVDEYLGKFEDLKAEMLIRNPVLNEAHFISSFMGGLKKEIKYVIKMFKLITLSFAIEQARMQEKAIEAALKKDKTDTRPIKAHVSSFTPKPSVMTSTRPTTYRLSPEVYEYRKNNHLCFRCGDKYTPRHKCKNRQLNCIKGITEDGQAAWATPTETSKIIKEQALTDMIIEGEIQQEMQEAICLSALSGNHNGVNTILVKGIAKNRNLTVMVDSGSTHSFIDS
ncbi:hypothetical protein KY290_016997 [Solanum tuberosum]|uniref:Ty3 transposon capsid-like protein domain-containing protein n=1 Tax=Solanum tuberosum TaxID=4113 RepID=A0ABQ7VA17_SOLTU|nr:hypothetical protein KY284_016065 [Solanum tuberosum]KAH0760924.1 hypothetical protein KY290_016997 [Solanum tuberosum]